MKEKTWKQIEQSRNRRLWITGVGLPVAGILTTLYCNVPGFRNAVNNIPYNIKKGIAHMKNKIGG